MNKEEKKAYILKEWNTSSGKRISEMLTRYFRSQNLGETRKIDSYKESKKIFGV